MAGKEFEMEPVRNHGHMCRTDRKAVELVYNVGFLFACLGLLHKTLMSLAEVHL